MTKFNFLSITIIFLTFVITIGNFLIFSTKSVNVGAIIESSSSSNSSLSRSSSVSNSSRNSSSRNSSVSSSSRSQNSVSSVKTSSSSSLNNQVSSPKTSSSKSSMILNSSSSSSFSLVSSTVSKSSSSKLSSSTVSSSFKISATPIVQNPNPLPIKITEAGFMRPEDYNNNLCLTSENNCGQFKWLEVFNPNDSSINLKDYRIVFGTFIDNSITDTDFLVNPKSFALVKNYSVTQTTSIVDQFPNVAPTTFVKNVDNKTQNNLSVVIQNSAKTTIDSFIIENLSSVAGSNAGKIKTSFFRCANPSQNQNYTLTEKKPINQIPFANTLGYEFYGTPNRDDDSCTVQSSSSAQPVIVGPTGSVTFTPPTPAVDITATQTKTQATNTEIIKNTVVETVPIAQTVSTPEIKKSVEGAIKTKPVVNKLVEYYKQATPIETNQYIKVNNTERVIRTHDIQLTESIKPIIPNKSTIQSIQKSIKPITKKVALPIVNQEIETKEVLEIDYQPSQLQWNFLSLIAIAFVLSKIYREFRDKISTEVFGIQRV